MKYFNDCTTLDELKARFKQLAKQYHPDLGGDTATMQRINKEYAFASASILRGANVSAEELDEKITELERYRATLEKIIHLPDIIIELVGLWIWVTGNTRAVKNELRAAGLFFASKKQAWYYRPAELKALRGSNKSLEEIKAKFGSQTLKATGRNTIDNK